MGGFDLLMPGGGLIVVPSGDLGDVFIGSDRFSDIGQARFNNAVLRLNIDDVLFADFQINLKGVNDLPDNSLIL
ncbi:hypothetical protein WH7805_10668 [Synechococcus sp. WH 7805]|uniref:hypothetical protein n=1 Tax=unclassified Synechococcus TaxID=2626047 RepID=UPI00006B68AF|nr:hypothetical protein [Synechococcus sp. WH 7805]EAR17378.1 hypothetical protein WH7805_10668 [Synechococcus sp. WH 7805]